LSRVISPPFEDRWIYKSCSWENFSSAPSAEAKRERKAHIKVRNYLPRLCRDSNRKLFVPVLFRSCS